VVAFKQFRKTIFFFSWNVIYGIRIESVFRHSFFSFSHLFGDGVGSAEACAAQRSSLFSTIWWIGDSFTCSPHVLNHSTKSRLTSQRNRRPPATHSTKMRGDTLETGWVASTLQKWEMIDQQLNHKHKNVCKFLSIMLINLKCKSTSTPLTDS